ncbi:MAG: 50S ribosomal protein L13 [Bacteroidetes bacterium]|nr:MAG: 50S ribosomal protein L13 [Bacteroidota bacterium]
MDTLSYRTDSVSKEQAEHKWYVVDAENQVVGRLCSHIAAVLRGKNKPSFTPHADTGDYVIVINADKVRFTGDKWAQKEYIDFSLWPGGQKRTPAEAMHEKDPRRVIERAVKGMLPKTKLGRQVFKRMFVYAGTEHPHTAQKPEPLKF